jgi:hypothetical protein
LAAKQPHVGENNNAAHAKPRAKVPHAYYPVKLSSYMKLMRLFLYRL